MGMQLNAKATVRIFNIRVYVHSVIKVLHESSLILSSLICTVKSIIIQSSVTDLVAGLTNENTAIT